MAVVDLRAASVKNAGSAFAVAVEMNGVLPSGEAILLPIKASSNWDDITDKEDVVDESNNTYTKDSTRKATWKMTTLSLEPQVITWVLETMRGKTFAIITEWSPDLIDAGTGDKYQYMIFPKAQINSTASMSFAGSSFDLEFSIEAVTALTTLDLETFNASGASGFQVTFTDTEFVFSVGEYFKIHEKV